MKYNIFSIIEPSEIRAIAFSEAMAIPTEMLSGANIEYVVSRFIIPVTGEKLLEKVAQGEYDNLKRAYLHNAISLYVRHVSAYDDDTTALSTLSRARHYLRVLSSHLERNRDAYPEYCSSKNILKRCRIHGDMVQSI